ncbi:MAG: hypothetical protein MZU95_07825 [Desulfomicrobium escambiense]|nr:hypothetical protein [Desulfomicrobium escambiense]
MLKRPVLISPDGPKLEPPPSLVRRIQTHGREGAQLGRVRRIQGKGPAQHGARAGIGQERIGRIQEVGGPERLAIAEGDAEETAFDIRGLAHGP